MAILRSLHRAASHAARAAFPIVAVMTAVVLVPSLARGQQAPAPAFPQLAEDARSPEARVRKSAARALGETRSAEALAVLAPLLGDEERGIRQEAIKAVLAIYVTPPAKKDVHDAEDAFELARYRATPWTPTETLTPALVRALGDDWWYIRRDALYALGVITVPPVDDRLAFELMQSLMDREPSVRRAAARVLGRLEVTAASTMVVGAINDDDLDVRMAALRAVGELREGRAVQALTEQFEFYQRGAAGRAALDALARVGHPSSVPVFEAQTASRNDAFRRAAYEGLARAGAVGAAAPAIEAALAGERDREVAAAMTYALVSAGRAPVERLAEFLGGRFTGGAAQEYLVDLARTRGAAAEVAALARHADPVVRERVVLVLGVVGGADAAAVLREAAERDGSEDVRAAAQLALSRLQMLERRGERGSGLSR